MANRKQISGNTMAEIVGYDIDNTKKMSKTVVTLSDSHNGCYSIPASAFREYVSDAPENQHTAELKHETRKLEKEMKDLDFKTFIEDLLNQRKYMSDNENFYILEALRKQGFDYDIESGKVVRGNKTKILKGNWYTCVEDFRDFRKGLPYYSDRDGHLVIQTEDKSIEHLIEDDGVDVYRYFKPSSEITGDTSTDPHFLKIEELPKGYTSIDPHFLKEPYSSKN